MNTAHWHLALNHFPIISTIMGSLILIVGYVFFRKNDTVRNIALGVFVFSAIVAVPAYFSGEGAEEIVEGLPGVTENTIEQHEDLGKLFFIAIEILGILAILSFITFRMKNKLSSFLYPLTMIAALGISIFGLQVANSGGKVRHSEINTSAGQYVPHTSTANDDN